jgi:hypothetical protein
MRQPSRSAPLALALLATASCGEAPPRPTAGLVDVTPADATEASDAPLEDAGTDSPVDAAPDLAPPSSPGSAPVFGPLTVVVATPGNSRTPVVATAGDAVHALWHDFTPRPDGGEVPALRHAWRPPGGTNWHDAGVVLSEAGRNLFPAVTVSLEPGGAPTLHIAWQRELDGASTLMHAALPSADAPDLERLGPPRPIVSGRLPRLVAAGSALHLVGFDGEALAHAFASDASRHAFAPSPPWPLDDAFVNTLDLAAVAEGPTSPALLAAFATSPGETSYDVRRARWTPEAGWGPRETLHASPMRSSDDLDAAPGPGGAAWVWTEQDLETPEDIPVVALHPSLGRVPVRVTREAGFAMSPTAARLPDGRLAVAWVTPRDTVAVSFGPEFRADLDLGGVKASFPHLSVAADGALHLVVSARDAAGVQQIWHAEAR